MGEPDVELEVSATPRQWDEMIERHSRLGDVFTADVAAPTVPFIDLGRDDLLKALATFSGSSAAFLFGVLLWVFPAPLARGLTRSLGIGLAPSPRMVAFLVDSRVRFLDAFSAMATQSIGSRRISVVLTRRLRSLAAGTRLLRNNNPSASTVVPMHKPKRFTLYPVALTVSPIGNRYILSAAALALHADNDIERMWFK